MEAVETILLFDYYGDLLTERQKICFDMHYNQDLSLSEIAQELSISRQAVHDTLTRTEQLLKNMEARLQDKKIKISYTKLKFCTLSEFYPNLNY